MSTVFVDGFCPDALYPSIKAFGTFGFVNFEAVVCRGMGTLLAGHARADAAANANGHDLGGVTKINPIGINQLAGLRNMAAKANGKMAALGVMAIAAFFKRTGDAEIDFPVGHLGKLHIYPAWLQKGRIDIPARAGP